MQAGKNDCFSRPLYAACLACRNKSRVINDENSLMCNTHCAVFPVNPGCSQPGHPVGGPEWSGLEASASSCPLGVGAAGRRAKQKPPGCYKGTACEQVALVAPVLPRCLW